ncbi:bifunctional riboflavin kinase/FAD synthetase [Stieleria marina]|uniref:Riboflavin biosynthesis protein n=1 Tax=Stieleria marina TaxID=1930275 RepID=A0A517NP31_9BACT|nr:Riboflavin kinase [Planctomycetes bacterium K23_9]
MTKIVHFSQLSKSSADDLAGESLDSDLTGGVVSIGNFDGVHRGHRALLGEVTQQAKHIGAPTIAVIFDPHPTAILRPELAPERLTWVERRGELMGQVDIDFLLVVETTAEFLSLSAEAFFQSLIVEQLQAKAIVEGPNFFFGRGRTGNVDTLAALCQQNQIRFTIAQPTLSDDQLISSTRIRNLLQNGSIDQANQFLGTSYCIRGQVVTGQQRGRTIGFPTANLADVDVVIPGHGVYGGMVTIDGKDYDAAIHIGPNPTFGDSSSKIEVHVLDFHGDLYQTQLVVSFVSFVRDVVKFDSAEHLTAQLKRDVTTIRDQLTLHRAAASAGNSGT